MECQYSMRQVPREGKYQFARENTRASEAHKRERPTDILSLCHGVFTDLIIFIYILEHFFPTNMEAPFRLSAHSRYKIYKKGRLNIIKRSKVPFSGLRFLVTDLWNLDSSFYLASRKIVLKIG